MKPFKYFDRGDMAIIGRNHAVADLLKHKLHLKGFLGLMSWLFIHVVSLVSYTNKIRTLYNWTVAYLTRDQSLRMIFRSGRSEQTIADATPDRVVHDAQRLRLNGESRRKKISNLPEEMAQNDN